MPKGLEGESIREAFQKRGYDSIETMEVKWVECLLISLKK